jgi:hypothetical protein
MRLVPNLPMYLPDAWLKQVQGEAPVRIVVHS